MVTSTESLAREPDDVGLVDLHLGQDHRQVGDGHEQAGLPRERAGHRHLALLDGQPHHASRDRRGQPGLGQVVPCLLQAGARLLQLRPGGLPVGLRHVVGRSAPARRPRARSGWRPSCGELPRAVPGPLRLVQVGPGLRQRGLGGRHDALRPRHRRLVLRRVDLDAGTGPCLTRSPSRTAIRMMRPVMSALMSTEVLASIFPLAVTALTRSRRATCSSRTSVPACFFLLIR